MSEDTTRPEGIKSPDVCPARDSADLIIRRQMQRYVDWLHGKKIIPVLFSGLYVVNCDQHEQPIFHLEFVPSSFDGLTPEVLPHAINATEKLLAMLKARQG